LTDYPLIWPIYKGAIIYSTGIVIGTSIHVRNTVRDSLIDVCDFNSIC